MCGRFCLTHAPEDVSQRFDVALPEEFPARYNIAPSQPVLIVIGGSEHRPEAWQSGRQALLARWGLIPAWTRDVASMPLLFNARSETAAARNAFRPALTHRRCIVPASGFYEWRKQISGRPIPYFIRPADRQAFGFAAIMETYLAADGSEIDTVAILTRPAAGRLADIHPREPVTLQRDMEQLWLDCRNVPPHALQPVFSCADEIDWQIDAISDRVNSATDMSPDIQRPRPAPEPPAQGRLAL